MPKPIKPPKPAALIPDPPAPDVSVWQCAICGGLTDLLVCPIDGNAAPGVKLNG